MTNRDKKIQQLQRELQGYAPSDLEYGLDHCILAEIHPLLYNVVTSDYLYELLYVRAMMVGNSYVLEQALTEIIKDASSAQMLERAWITSWLNAHVNGIQKIAIGRTSKNELNRHRHLLNSVLYSPRFRRNVGEHNLIKLTGYSNERL